MSKSIFASYWFWLLAIGIIIILVAALIRTGVHENNGWIWWIFVIGLILALLGIVFGIVTWMNDCEVVTHDTLYTANHVAPHVHVEPAVPVIVPSYPSTPVAAVNSTIPYQRSELASPVRAPSQISVNMPQAQRGFTATETDLASLAPL